MEGIGNPRSPVWTADGCHWASQFVTLLPGHSLSILLSFRSWTSWAGVASATLKRVIPHDPHNHSFSQAPSPIVNWCSQSTYLAVMKWEKSCLIWGFWHWPAPQGALRTPSDHPEIHRATAGPPEPAPIWTYNQGRPSTLGPSHHTVHQVPWSRDAGQGPYWISEQQGVQKHLKKNLSSLFCHVFADLDFLLLPFLAFFLSLLLFHFPTVKFISFSVTLF